MEAGWEDKEIVTKPTDEAAITQEPATEAGDFYPQEASTPSIDSACGIKSGHDEGQRFERLLLLLELQKWKKLALYLQEGVIPLKMHKIMMDSLREKWLKEEWKREEEAQGRYK